MADALARSLTELLAPVVEGGGADVVLAGTVTAADENSVTLRVDGRERTLALGDVRRARVVVSF